MKKSKIYIWGKKPSLEIESYAKEQNIPILRVEDGFVRSVSLGSDLTKAYSLVVDSRGIYFDPTQESDLEHILNTHTFDNEILKRSKNLQQHLITSKISKYNNQQDKNLTLENLKEGQRVIMVPGQVEDDASIIYGAKGMTNLQLLQQTRANKPNAYIIYKPHPDVLSGNRKGHVTMEDAMEYCDTIITDASIDSVLTLADEVHTMTSLVGLEALIRGKIVMTYGLPFYAGWGLTVDKKACTRRNRKLTLSQLVAGAYILYPRYIDPISLKLCEIEWALKVLHDEKNRYHYSAIYRIEVKIKSFIYKKYYALLRHLLRD